jgi:hypothetical protein
LKTADGFSVWQNASLLLGAASTKEEKVRTFRNQILWVVLSSCSLVLSAQEIKIANHSVQYHGFATQGFIHTNTNNWLTMHTNGVGSGAFTDMGFNVGMQFNDKVRVAAQFYDRKLGALGDWEPQLDWAMIEYRPKDWLGFRGGKVKTVMGLYNDKQDMDFANTYALLPQSIYPIDLRDAAIAHLGGDIYGRVRLMKHLGSVDYTAYGGRRSDSMHSGYPYLLGSYGIQLTSYGGPVYGGDLRWRTPLRGLLVGVSRLNQKITGKGESTGPGGPGSSTTLSPYTEWSKHDWTNQYFGQYTADRWHAESEYRRYFRDQMIASGAFENQVDARGWYVGGGFTVCKWFEAGSYYSHYRVFGGQSKSPGADHDYDKVITGKFTVNRFLTIKVEGHFMDGYGDAPYPNGFYSLQNSKGFAANTNGLLMRTGLSF